MRQVFVALLTSHVKHKDQHFYILENVLPLRLEVLLHEKILTTAIPKWKHQIAQKPDPMLIHIMGVSDAVGIASEVICKNDGAHRRFTCAHPAHQKNFLDAVL